MPVFEIKQSIKAHVNVVWSVLTDLENFTEISPDIIKVEKVSGENLGLIQRLHHRSGKVWEEECTVWKPKSNYTMRVISGHYPLPVTEMERTCSLREGNKNIEITITYRYTPKYGPLGTLLDRFRIRPLIKSFSAPLMHNLISKIYDAEWGFHVTAGSIIKKKGIDTVTISPDMKLPEANKLRSEKKIGCVVVLDNNEKVVGILSERDIVNALAEQGADILDKPVSEIMSKKIISCSPDDDLPKLMTHMTDRRIRHLPVMDGDQLVGIVSIGDVVKARIDELEVESEALHNYIKDRRWHDLSLQIGRSGAVEVIGSVDDAIPGK